MLPAVQVLTPADVRCVLSHLPRLARLELGAASLLPPRVQSMLLEAFPDLELTFTWGDTSSEGTSSGGSGKEGVLPFSPLVPSPAGSEEDGLPFSPLLLVTSPAGSEGEGLLPSSPLLPLLVPSPAGSDGEGIHEEGMDWVASLLS